VTRAAPGCCGKGGLHGREWGGYNSPFIDDDRHTDTHAISEKADMSDSVEPMPLHVHTLNTLCNELVGGRAVLIDDGGEEFRFSSPETRSLFDWYLRNPDKWAKNVMKRDVETLANQVSKAPPETPTVAIAAHEQERRVLHLKSMRAHRFAGIHRYGSPEEPPADFKFEFDKPLTLIEGMNGAGKTSLLSAIVWCLTGHIYRSQRSPEPVDETVRVDIADDSDAASDHETTNDIAAITPLPPSAVLTTLRGVPVPLDTWVELVFVDEAANEVGPIRRCVERSPRGKLRVVEPDLPLLNTTPVSLDVGTKMPGLIPYIQLGKPSDLGQAIAALTGIKPLQDLAKHAAKSQAKLRKDLANDRKKEIEAFDSDYRKTQDELANLLQDHPEVAPEVSIPSPGDDRKIGRVLKSCAKHIDDQQAQAYEDAKAVLGEEFDPTDGTARRNLENSVGPAIGLLEFASLGRLHCANRLRSLAALTDGQIADAETLIEHLLNEAGELAQLAEKPDVASRLRLYARVAGWVKRLPEQPHVIQECPVCQSALEGTVDPVTQEAVQDHIQRFLDVETDYLEKTLTEWQKAAIDGIASELAEALATEVRRDLPGQPTNLIETAFTEELFESPSLSESLSPLQSAVQSLCARHLEGLPRFEEPAQPEMPECLGGDTGELAVAFRRLSRAIAFARWRNANAEPCAAAFKKIIGEVARDSEAPRSRPTDIEKWTLADRLMSLDEMVKRATPLKVAMSKLQIMREKLADRRRTERLIRLYGRTADAIEPLLRLDKLVEQQVSSLMNTLSSSTQSWKDQLYSPAFHGAPAVCKADVQTDGSLMMEATAGGSKASACQISNASDLRATLLAFLLAFWQHLLDTRGGLSLLLLDDLHELFDAANRRRVANALPVVVENGGRLVVTSNDHAFGTQISRAFAAASCDDNVDWRNVHSLREARPCIELGVFLDAVESKRQQFEKPDNENEHQPARDYVNELRVYVEARLLDLFEACPASLPQRATLSDLVAAIRSSRNAGVEPLTSLVFGNLVSDPAFAQGSEFVELMNLSHHGRAQDITYTAVKTVAPVCKRVCRLVAAAHEAYERWLRRDPPQGVPALPGLPQLLTLSHKEVPVIEGLAAFTAQTGPSELLENDEVLSTSSFDSHSVYVLKTRNLGFSGPPGCRVLVKLKDGQPPDNCLVVALHRDRVSVGRLHRDDEKPEVVIIGSEAENPLKRPPSLFLPATEVRLLQIVGVLFDFTPHYSRSSDDAVHEPNYSGLDGIQLAFRVDRESALPLAIEGQMIVGGAGLSLTLLPEREGSIVALATSEGCALKRIGKAVPGASHVRMFESVGGLGESMLVRTEDLEEDQLGNLPLLHSAREVLGVLYELD
jgi:AAA domain